ncbi:hypothetical protein M6B38_321020 [Iris pallida]|uniref:Uncharacterized protein n=1 Tax=Iris pallida TaxID=29817 RepID=A0AAX6HCB6_IRIPA|nr:hypothetical protein M6B38_321015 [Iris pallida]KAJ6838257.1 hypothetical protein M6B38_321020 [Iris pallida]
MDMLSRWIKLDQLLSQLKFRAWLITLLLGLGSQSWAEENRSVINVYLFCMFGFAPASG